MKTSAILIFFLFFASVFSCKDYQSAIGTPSQFKYEVPTTVLSKYPVDIAVIHSVLLKMLQNHVRPFDLEKYDDQTTLYVDSLIYGPDQLRMIVFVIAENSSTKLSQPKNDEAFFYDAYYLFCSRQSITAPIKVYDYFGFRLSTFYDRTEIREALREYCFYRMQRKEGNEHYYNIDDRRFWTSRYFERVLNNSTATGVD